MGEIVHVSTSTSSFCCEAAVPLPSLEPTRSGHREARRIPSPAAQDARALTVA